MKQCPLKVGEGNQLWSVTHHHWIFFWKIEKVPKNQIPETTYVDTSKKLSITGVGTIVIVASIVANPIATTLAAATPLTTTHITTTPIAPTPVTTSIEPPYTEGLIIDRDVQHPNFDFLGELHDLVCLNSPTVRF